MPYGVHTVEGLPHSVPNSLLAPRLHSHKPCGDYNNCSTITECLVQPTQPRSEEAQQLRAKRMTKSFHNDDGLADMAKRATTGVVVWCTDGCDRPCPSAVHGARALETLTPPLERTVFLCVESSSLILSHEILSRCRSG